MVATTKKGLLWLVVLGLAATALPTAAAQDDYIDQAPPTVYEADEMSPQNMDYDAENDMFIAHPGWIDDKLIHYYKFRMYTPSTYPETVPMGETNPTIPIAPLYLLTTDGGFGGIVADQNPIIRFHTDDGEDYSDFVEVFFVTVPSDYTANDYKSYGDLESADLVPPEGSGIIVNAPVVPTGSTLEHPTADGTAPIDGVTAWYRGVEVQLFFFETTDQGFADHFNPLTRQGDAAQDGSGFEITVSPDMVEGQAIRWEPIWHINQIFTGVTPGQNNGGPADVGQRNVIALDRLDEGYSPLWQVWWVTQAPPGYEPDQASHASQYNEGNGFKIAKTPMFVNCPNVGPHGGGDTNDEKADSFDTSPHLADGESVRLDGSLVMEGDATVTLHVGGQRVDETTTNMMGGWSFTLSADELADGENAVEVKNAAGETVAEYTVQGGEPEPAQPIPAFTLGIALAVLVAIALVVTFVANRKKQ